MDYVKAFLVGGIICALVQILMEKTKLMPGRIMVLLVVSGAILGCIGLYQPLCGVGGSGSLRTPSGLWKRPVEGRDGGRGQGRALGRVQGWFHRWFRRNLRSPGVRLPGQPGV